MMRPQALSIVALAIITVTLLDIVGGFGSKPYHFVLLLTAASLGLAAQVWDYIASRQGNKASALDDRGGRKPPGRGGS